MEILNEHRESEVAIVSIDQTRTQEITSEHREGEVTVFTNNATPEVHLTTRREEAKETVNENSRPIIVVAENIETVKEVAERADLLDDVITSLPQIMQAANAAEIAEQAKLEAISAKNEALESKETAVASAETALSSSSIALESANKAQESASLADQSAKSALTSKESASTSAKSASESMTQAKQSAQSASASASLASEKETLVKEYVTRAETASADAENAKTIVVNSTNKAETAERNAAASAQAAKNSENIALQSENKALASATTATQEASRATEQASLASSYSAQALQASNTSTQQATIATEQANKATEQATKSAQNATVATEKAQSAKEYAEQAKTEAESISSALSGKQDILTAGEGITIEGNVISAEGGKLPDNVYTQENLLGGKNIEIVPEPVEGGIDEYTLSCFHLDGTAVDEVTGYTLSPVMDNSVHKFGTGSSMWTNSTSFPWSLNNYESFSFDYWYYHKTSRSSYLGLRKSTFAIYLLGLYFSSGATKPKFRVIKDKYDIDVDFEANKWTHVYIYYNAEDRSFHLFVNGKEVFSAINATDFSGVKEFTNDGYTESRFDEIRISKCIRWTEDFEPPTEPYSKAEPTGNKVINFTGTIPSKTSELENNSGFITAEDLPESGGASKAIGEVYFSQSSLATDNPGALPLWTGESVATAMYPSLTEWVTKHTELQCTAEEYESALTEYGECPKYVLSADSLRLPKLANYIKMANGIDGITQKEAGLPNITGSFSSAASYNDPTGAFTRTEGASDGGNENWDRQDIHTLDASLSSEVYGKSDTVTPAHTTLYPWVTAYTSAIEASVAQAAEFQQGLSGKADTNLGNIPTNYDYVVERYDDGKGNWYEVWKSGRLRQGGFISMTAPSQANHVITFLKPFANTFYTFVNLPVYGSQIDTRYLVEKPDARTTTSVTVVMSLTRNWMAEGQGA